MTMKLTQLKTHWNADEAEVVIDFLDELKGVLLTVYGDEIKDLKQKKDYPSDHTDYKNIDDHDIF